MSQPYDCSHVVDIADESRHHLVLANEYVRAFVVDIPPGDRTLCHRHPQDYLLYSASASEIISATRDEEPKRLNYCDGECELLSAGLVHVVENIGASPVRNVVVELSPRAGELRRGSNPKWVGGEWIGGNQNISQILNGERAAIFKIGIGPGDEVEIAGPAMVAAPYRDQLNPACVGDIDVRQNPMCDVAWVPPGGAAVLWGCGEQTETAIVFQIGRTEEQGLAVSNVRNPLRSLRAHIEPE